MISVDNAYTIQDHEERERDAYALEKYSITLEWLEKSSAKNGLLGNIGCGAGHFSALAASRGFRVEACEPDYGAYSLALKAAENQTAIQVSNCGIFEFTLSKRADILVMHDVLEHIEDERSVVIRLSQLLDHDGVGVISVPALPVLFGPHDVKLGHFRRYTRKTLIQALTSHFTIVRIRYFGFTLLPIAFLFARVLKKPYPIGSDGEAIGWKAKFIQTTLQILCKVDHYIPFPLGTSLIVEFRPKAPF